MPSSSLVEVEVEVEVEVGGEVKVGVEQKYVPQIRSNFTFSVGWCGCVGLGGDLESKAISASNIVEVEVEA